MFCEELQISPGAIAPSQIADFASLFVDTDVAADEPENPETYKVYEVLAPGALL